MSTPGFRATSAAPSDGMLILAAITVLALAIAFVDFAVGHRRMVFLKDVPPAASGPSLSIVVAARNEARGIEAAARSLLALDYPLLEIVAVNDRSTDETGAILARLMADHPRLKTVDVVELPPGWLGKNYALSIGAAAASGEILLFTDADIVFEPTTLRRAVTIMEGGKGSRPPFGIDHLAAVPDIDVPGVALNAFMAAFGVFFSLYARPWKACDPRSRSHIGVGAFNMIRRSVYSAIGTHRAIAMRPDDDMKLGKLVKKHGFRQQAVFGHGQIAVEWYASLRELIDGLMKNAFAGVDYSLWAVAGASVALLLMDVWPFVALFVTTGWVRALNGVSVLLIAGIFAISARAHGARFAALAAFPAAALLFVYIVWKSALVAVTSGTVTWRGTAYPLAEMRANRV
jgi:glycosyltransferase involved in cell wall biosynthesis